MLKICGNRLEKYDKIHFKEKPESKTLNDYLLKYIRDPTSRGMNLWFIFVSLVYYIGLIQDTLVLANRFTLLITGWRFFIIFRAILMLADLLISFFIATQKGNKIDQSNVDNFSD